MEVVPPMGVDLQGDLRATEEAWLFLSQENPLIHLVELNPAIQVALLFKQKNLHVMHQTRIALQVRPTPEFIPLPAQAARAKVIAHRLLKALVQRVLTGTA
jgi:hypothetical protein